MKTWRVYGSVVGSVYLGEVEADTKDEAEEIIGQKAHISLCHQCAKQCDDAEIVDIQAELIRE